MSALILQYQNSKPSVINMPKKISIIGGRGFTGQELIKLIDSHPKFELAQAFSSSVAGKEIMIDERKPEKTYALLDENTEFVEEDVVVLALPNNEATKWADKISKQNSEAIILDLSADHRFDVEWHYSVPELTKTIGGNKISNPGCYATAMQLMLAPINNMIDGEVNFFGISGYSGAGATPNDRNDPNKLKNNIIPYSLNNHIHEREVSFHMQREINFMPHVADFFRGILITGNVSLKSQCSLQETRNIFHDFYDEHSFIVIKEEFPSILEVINTPNAMIGGFDIDESKKRLSFCCSIDNLLKGAASQAIQNLNNAMNFDEKLGLKKR
jgi:N-acetyl-gamma-glutamyl-phosphate reductase